MILTHGHFETRGNHCLLLFVGVYRGISIPGFLGCRISPFHSTFGARTKNRPGETEKLSKGQHWASEVSNWVALV